MIRPGIWRRELAVPLQSIQTELNRLFDEFWRPPGESGGPFTAATDEASAAEPTVMSPATWTPAIDLHESATELILMVDLPGVEPSSINLSLAGNVLSIRGEKLASTAQAAPSTPPAGVHRGRIRERLAGAFHRQVTLVDEVEFDRIEAQSRDGVLTVRLPKRAVGQPRTIAIQATGS